MSFSNKTVLLSLLLIGKLGLLTSCSELTISSSHLLAPTLPAQSTGKTLTYSGSYRPDLGPRMREKMLAAYSSGNQAEANSYKGLINSSERLKIRIQRQITSATPSFSDSVTAYEGSHSKELKKDRVVFAEILLNTPTWQNRAYTYATIPLQQIRSYPDLNRQWQVVGPAGTRTVANKKVAVTKVIYTERLDDYRESRSEFLLSDEIPGRIASYQNSFVTSGKSQPHISITLKSFK